LFERAVRGENDRLQFIAAVDDFVEQVSSLSSKERYPTSSMQSSPALA
jgi:hypothetical protein